MTAYTQHYTQKSREKMDEHTDADDKHLFIELVASDSMFLIHFDAYLIRSVAFFH